MGKPVAPPETVVTERNQSPPVDCQAQRRSCLLPSILLSASRGAYTRSLSIAEVDRVLPQVTETLLEREPCLLDLADGFEGKAVVGI